MLSLNTRKFYIPGETSEKAKLRVRAIENGVLIVLTYCLIQARRDSLKMFLQEDFFERLEECDIDLHFQYADLFYSRVPNLQPEMRESIDQLLAKRQEILRDARIREIKIQNERRLEEEARELQ